MDSKEDKIRLVKLEELTIQLRIDVTKLGVNINEINNKLNSIYGFGSKIVWLLISSLMISLLGLVIRK